MTDSRSPLSTAALVRFTTLKEARAHGLVLHAKERLHRVGLDIARMHMDARTPEQTEAVHQYEDALFHLKSTHQHLETLKARLAAETAAEEVAEASADEAAMITRSLERVSGLLSFVLFLLTPAQRETWSFVEADLKDDLLQMHAAGYGPWALRFKIAWEVSVELGGLLWQRVRKLVPLGAWFTKLFF